ncbi:hypothetical protein NIM87_16370 [Devosia sp. XJ19-1]|uniref:Uncharacterized protein n=1 Tax=Devosia ureilytica TaxID=2952754 RepID=A0A9Q4AQY6_9HYPH|nr:hypothetical protein [Devosia ureilytica]MCP8885085.1 hypothetical protein [Devosia ureilytica]MCP8888808.1 hypothetical protein [Devosia ureilytica]
MKTIWPAATLAIVITSYFAWSSYSTPPVQEDRLEDCHRMAGEFQAIHASGGTISSEMLGDARGCAIAFGRDWASQGGERAAQLRAEGAQRIQ